MIYFYACSFPILYSVIPHTEHFPRIAGLPFFSVTCSVSTIVLFALHFTQYASTNCITVGMLLIFNLKGLRLNYYEKFVIMFKKKGFYMVRRISNGANTSATNDITVIIVFNEGPAVSLNGSPTVSPVTAAL